MADLVKIDFHGEELLLTVINGEDYVFVKPICDYLGLNWEAQRRRLKAASKRWGTYISVGASAGGEQEMTCIPARRLEGWLHTINNLKVRPELRDKLIRYQQELDEVIFRHRGGQHTADAARRAGQLRKSQAYLLAFNPLWAKIAALQQAGVRQAEVHYHVRRSFAETQAAVTAMHQAGVIAAAEWSDNREDAEALTEADHGA